ELVTINPPEFRRQDWHSNTLRWSGLTSGITRGTSFCMRKALELEITAWPASAKRGSSSLAPAASSAAKMILGAFSGLADEIRISAARAGTGVFSFHRAASPYMRPSERSEAASQATSNQGWCSSSCTKRWPTMPVAPRIPTGNFSAMGNLFWILHDAQQLSLQLITH